MEQHIQSLVKHLFQKETLQEVTEDELRSFTETHPYSAVGQFLFAKKLQESHSDQLITQAEKTSLYFHNPTWTSWLLMGDQTEWEPIHTDQKIPSTKTIEEPATEEPVVKESVTEIPETLPAHVPEPELATHEEEEMPLVTKEELPLP